MRLSASSSSALREFLVLSAAWPQFSIKQGRQARYAFLKSYATVPRYGIIEIARTGVVGMARASGAFSNMIEDGALVAERVLERVEMDATALPPG